MSKLYVAITGGIGSGKSLVLEYLRELHYPTFSCDALYKDIIVSKAYIEKIENEFPSVIENGAINRKLLSEIVFNNPSNREKLNSIAHPMIMDLLMQKMKEADDGVVFAEVPLLFEGNYENLFDRVVYVWRDKSQRIAAVEKRDGLRLEHIKKRIETQFNGETLDGQNRLKQCNAYLIKNSDGPQELKGKVLDFLNTL